MSIINTTFQSIEHTLLFQIVGDLLYSASMDCTLRTWDLLTGRPLQSVRDHCDYIHCLLVAGQYVATGGRGDKAIFVYRTDDAGALEKLHRLEGHSGWITNLIVMGDELVSGSEDGSIRFWQLETGVNTRSLPQDEGITTLCSVKDGLLLFGDKEGKLSYLDVYENETIHLLPNILVGTGRYRRSCKYHDKSIDTMHLSNNGYLITGSSGSKFVKIWRLAAAEDIEATEVTELQILRDHADYLTILKVFDGTIFSSCSDGHVYLQAFPSGTPHYEMATEQESSADVVWNGGIASPEAPTEVCEGPRCKTGKTGLVRSSSSFQVSFSLRKSVCSVDGKLRLPAMAEVEEDDSDDDSEEDSEYEVVYVTDSSETESESE